MSFRVIHLHLMTYPTPTPSSVVDYACAFAKAFEASLSISIVRPIIHVPSHWLAAPMFASTAYNIEAKAKEAAHDLGQAALKAAGKAGVVIKVEKVAAEFPQTDTDRFFLGRAADLGIHPLPRLELDQKISVENWLFQTGHPTLLFPEDAPVVPSFKTILVAWDFSRWASRAIADALPILKRAENVRLATVIGEKHLPVDYGKTSIVDYLAAHGIKAQTDEIQLAGNTIGGALLTQAATIGADMIVMGAFGHSRFQEFLLGGATRGVLAGAKIPILMSH